MGLFKKIGSTFKSLFSTGEPLPRHYREKEAGNIHEKGQSERRKKLIERRVQEGTSSKVYKNKKQPGQGESPYIDDFLEGFLFSQLASSCVYALQYDRTKNALFVCYLGGKGKNRGGPGKWFQYGSVDVGEAKQFYNNASKGVTTWDLLRIRGTLRGNKKPVKQVSSPPSYLPLGRKRANILEA